MDILLKVRDHANTDNTIYTVVVYWTMLLGINSLIRADF